MPVARKKGRKGKERKGGKEGRTSFVLSSDWFVNYTDWLTSRSARKNSRDSRVCFNNNNIVRSGNRAKHATTSERASVRASLLQNRNSAESEEKPWQAVARPLLDSRKLHPIVLATSRIVLASAFLSACKCCCTCCCCRQKAFALLSFCSLSVSLSDKQSSNGCK
jgi:hypothetical protein